MKMFAFTSKHHEGFSMFDTKTRVKRRTNWIAEGGPKVESCDLAYTIMETPFRRDVVKELCDCGAQAGHQDRSLFFPSGLVRRRLSAVRRTSASGAVFGAADERRSIRQGQELFGDRLVIVPDPSPEEVKRMMERHRAQLTELLTNYGTIDMLCLDMYLGPRSLAGTAQDHSLPADSATPCDAAAPWHWKLRRLLHTRASRTRSNRGSNVPWFVIYPLGTDFSYEPDAAKHKGTEWIVRNIVDCAAKGGGFMVGVGPSALGEFHPEAARQMRGAGAWLKVNGEGIYATRSREGDAWSEGDNIRYTRSKDGRTVYAFALGWPGRTLDLALVRPRAGSVIRLLGYPEALQWTLDSSRGLRIAIPENLQDQSHRPSAFAWGFRIETERA